MNRNEMILWGLLIAPFIYTAFIFDQLPDQVPLHWNIEGEVDRYGSKWEGILIIPLFNILLYFLMKYIPRLDPRKKNYELFKGPYYMIRLFISAFMLLIFFLIMRSSLGDQLSIDKLVTGSIFVLFMMIGNYMGNIRSNYFVGIRTPWTLENPEVWKRTHQVASRLWFGGGLAGLLGVVFLEKMALVILMIAIIVPLVLVPMVYSYRLYKKLKGEGSNGAQDS